jgi:hypothetical protein
MPQKMSLKVTNERAAAVRALGLEIRTIHVSRIAAATVHTTAARDPSGESYPAHSAHRLGTFVS